MKGIAALALIALLAACGGDAGPTDRFSGTWTGTAVASPTDTVHIVLTSAQTGSAITGTGTASDFTGSEAITFTGTSTAPLVNLVVIIAGADTLNYAGTFVSSDSISGALSGGTQSIALNLKKQ